MAGESVKCPSCGHEFGVGEVLTEGIRAQLERETRAAQAKAVEDARKDAAQAAQRDVAAQIKDLQTRATDAQKTAEKAQAAELKALRAKEEVDERARKLDLEVAREVDKKIGEREAGIRADFEKREKEAKALIDREKARWREDATQQQQAALKAEAERHNLELTQKDRQIAALRRDAEDMRQKAAQGSQEAQGEALEEGIEAALKRAFPQDRIEPVAKGTRGGDLVQRVCDERGAVCGTILWEAKNTKTWQRAWLNKIKADRRRISADAAVIVSVALPDAIKASGVGRIDGVWVSGLGAWHALVDALREGLIRVAYAREASKGSDKKMAAVYDYLTGDEFRRWVETIVDSSVVLQEQIAQERRAMERQWSERERHLQNLIKSTSGMHGELRAIAGGMASIPRLEMGPARLGDDD